MINDNMFNEECGIVGATRIGAGGTVVHEENPPHVLFHHHNRSIVYKMLHG
jgi:hypothetical protein